MGRGIVGKFDTDCTQLAVLDAVLPTLRNGRQLVFWTSANTDHVLLGNISDLL